MKIRAQRGNLDFYKFVIIQVMVQWITSLYSISKTLDHIIPQVGGHMAATADLLVKMRLNNFHSGHT